MRCEWLPSHVLHSLKSYGWTRPTGSGKHMARRDTVLLSLWSYWDEYMDMIIVCVYLQRADQLLQHAFWFYLYSMCFVLFLPEALQGTSDLREGIRVGHPTKPCKTLHLHLSESVRRTRLLHWWLVGWSLRLSCLSQASAGRVLGRDTERLSSVSVLPCVHLKPSPDTRDCIWRGSCLSCWGYSFVSLTGHCPFVLGSMRK